MNMATGGGSSGSKVAGIVVGLIVVIILAAGFVVYLPATSVGYVPVTLTNTSESTFQATSLVAIVNTEQTTFQTSSTTVVGISQATTATQPVWDESDISLQPNNYDYYGASLAVGTDVQISWSASIAVDVYIFNSAEFASYQASETTNPNIASDTAQTGSLDFHISGSDTYYLVVHDPNGFLGLGAANAGYTTTGSETYPTTTTTYITQTTTYLTSTPTVVTSTSTAFYTTSTPTTLLSTSTSTTTSTCSHYLWSWLGGAKSCP